MTEAEIYFNKVANDYDFWKKKNFYYYEYLMALYRSLIKPNSSVMEIGCGTGDILASLNPNIGVGIDISKEMVEIANKKYSSYSNLKFSREDIFDSNNLFKSEYIFLADVLEHISDQQSFLNKLSSRTSPNIQVIISLANPIWEPLLMLAEKLGMKMKEGPHKRYSVKKTEEMFKKAGFEIIETGYRLLIPKKVPGSDWINERFYNIRLFRNFGFIVYWILKKA